MIIKFFKQNRKLIIFLTIILVLLLIPTIAYVSAMQVKSFDSTEFIEDGEVSSTAIVLGRIATASEARSNAERLWKYLMPDLYNDYKSTFVFYKPTEVYYDEKTDIWMLFGFQEWFVDKEDAGMCICIRGYDGMVLYLGK